MTEETFPMAYAKIGTHVMKGEARTPITAKSARTFTQMLTDIRTDKRFNKLYHGQGVVPIPHAAGQTVQAFAPFQSLRKSDRDWETSEKRF